MTTSTIDEMHHLQVKTHSISKDELPQVLAFHMLTTCLNGNIAVVCESPDNFMKQVKKEWDKLMRTKVPYYRKNILFSAASPFDDIQANISFSTVKEYKLLPPMCSTLYVTCTVKKRDMYLLTSWMHSNSAVIIYKY